MLATKEFHLNFVVPCEKRFRSHIYFVFKIYALLLTPVLYFVALGFMEIC